MNAAGAAAGSGNSPFGLANLQELCDLLNGLPVHLTSVNLVELANLPYEPLDGDVDPGELTAARLLLDHYLYRVGDQRRGGGMRATGVQYTLCRYLLPFWLEQRGSDRPLLAGRMRIQDLHVLPQILAGERPLPAATVVADLFGRRSGRLAVTCHWLTPQEAASVCDLTVGEITETLGRLGLVSVGPRGDVLVRAMDLRAAGLLPERDRPHGLGRETAGDVLSIAKGHWERALDLGVTLTGRPGSIAAKRPLPANRGRAPKKATGFVPLERCLEVAAALHPVHQLVLWCLRLAALREGEAFGLRVGDRSAGLFQVSRIGGHRRYIRNDAGRFALGEVRPGTKGSPELVASTADGQIDDSDEPADALTRPVAIPAVLDALAAAFIEVFHTDPLTGQVDLDARLIPGLQEEDRAGIAAFDAALAVACARVPSAVGPAVFTSHDLRKSLNTELENAGVDDRALRLLLGHRSEKGKALDVHDAHYDLGLDEARLLTLAAEVGATVPDDVVDLRVPTSQLPQWGRSTRHAGRRAHIEATLLALGWYRPLLSSAGSLADGRVAAVHAAPKPEPEPLDDVVTTPVAAARLGISPSQVKRMLNSGELRGWKVLRDRRDVWVVPVAELDAAIRRRAGVPLSDAADRLGIDRNRLWRLLVELEICDPGRVAGERIRLSADALDRLDAELTSRADALRGSLTYSAVAADLGLTEPLVQTLARRGELSNVVDVRTRVERVTVESVEAYRRRNPGCVPVGDDEPVVAVSDVRAVLQESRHAISDLVCARQLAVVSVQRRQYVGSRSLREYLRRHPRPGGLERLALLEVTPPGVHHDRSPVLKVGWSPGDSADLGPVVVPRP